MGRTSYVRLHQHLFCAMAGLLAVCANVTSPTETSGSETKTTSEELGAVLGTASVLWIVAAWQLIHRTITEPKYRRRITLLSWGTLPLAAGGLYF